MVGQGHRYRNDLDVDAFEENTDSHRGLRYRTPQPDRTDVFSENSLPMFLSDYPDRPPSPSEFITPRRKQRRISLSSFALLATCGAAALAALYALATSDMTRNSLAKLDATMASLVPAPSVAAQLDRPQAMAADRQREFASAAKIEPPPKIEDQLPAPSTLKMAAASPSRDAITAAYQSALQGSAPAPVATTTVAEPPPTLPAEPIRRLDPGEVAASLIRANALIASGDVAAARLVLRHPADSGDPQATMTLAETYDPAFLQKLGVHGIAPDVAMARDWYLKAKKFGAAEAARRLEVLASR